MNQGVQWFAAAGLQMPMLLHCGAGWPVCAGHGFAALHACVPPLAAAPKVRIPAAKCGGR